MTTRSKIADLATQLVGNAVRLPGPTFAKHVALGLYSRHSSGEAYTVKLIAPSNASVDPADRKLIERIFQAFQLSKHGYQTAEEKFSPSSLWNDCIGESFSEFDLTTLDGFGKFLANFGCCKKFTGFEYGHLVHRCSYDRTMDTLLRHFAVPRMIEYWRKERGENQPLSSMRYPMHGNMTGVSVNGTPIPLNAFFDDQCSRMITDCVDHSECVIAELGGGYGGLAYCLLNNAKVCQYVGYDLPEVMACCSYYLIKSLPDRRFCLYGEDDSPLENREKYDAVLLPGFCLADMDEDKFNVFVNRSSLSEMNPPTAEAFLRQIWRSSDYFWHLNHESRRNQFHSGETSLLNADYPVPPSKKLLARFPEQTNLPYLLEMEGYDHFWYLYGPRV